MNRTSPASLKSETRGDIAANTFVQTGSGPPIREGSTQPKADRFWVRYLLTILLVALAYFAAGRFGLTFAFSTAEVTALFPATGVAVAALLLLGTRQWPAVFLGAFLVNVMTDEPLFVTFGIAVGNTLGPFVTVYLLRRFVDFDNALGRTRDALWLIGCSILGMTICATSGVANLALGGMIPWSAFGSVWWVWLVGDFMGAIVVAPPILAWAANPRLNCSLSRLGECVAIFLGLLVVGFLSLTNGIGTPLDIEFGILPFVIWPALRLGLRETTAAILLITGVAVSGAASGQGPFVGQNADANLILLEFFLATTAIVGLLIATTISERRQAQGQITDFIEHANVGLHNVGQDGTIQWANKAELELLGYSEEEYVGQNIAKFHVDQPVIQSLLASLKRCENVSNCEARLLCKDGSIKHVLINSIAFQEGGKFVHSRCFTHDITDRKRAEEVLARANEDLESRVADRTVALREEIHRHEQTQRELLESQERYTSVEAAVNDGIWDHNLLTGDVYLSPRWKSILGFADEELPNTMATFLDRIHPDERAAVYGAMQTARNNNTIEKYSVELRLQCKSGDYIWVNSRAKVIFDETGRQIRRLGAITDISERKRVTEMLAQSQKMEAIGQLTAGIAHDFNNLLAVIVGGLEFIAAAARRGLTADWELIEASVRATQRGTDLVKQLLAFSRQSPLKAQPVLVDQLVLDTLRLLDRTLGEQVEIVTLLNAPAAVALVDRTQLVNAFLKVALNARDAMPKGGHLTIATNCQPLQRPPAETDGGRSAGEEIRIAISDTGIGMTEEVRARAFEPFFTTKQGGLGSGLGLSMVMGFIEQSGGHVEIESTIDHGTTITICLPRVAMAAQGAGVSTADETDTAPTERTVLLVEDDRDVRIMTAARLKQLGYKVHGVATAIEALDVINSPAEIDVVLTDIVLPGGIDGMALLGEATRARPEMGLLCMSGYDPTQKDRKWLNIQNITFLEKPFSTIQLAQALDDAIAR